LIFGILFHIATPSLTALSPMKQPTERALQRHEVAPANQG